MPRFSRVTAVVLTVSAVALQQSVSAQNLSFSLFERYVESLRVQAGIPGLSAAIVQDGHIVWDHGFGYQDLENSVFASAITPYPISDLTQTFAAALVMQCWQNGTLNLDAPLAQWNPSFADQSITVRQVLSHVGAAPLLTFKYDPARYALLTAVVDSCASQSARTRVVDAILDRFVMFDSVPGRDLADATSDARPLFDERHLERYMTVLARIAQPYKVDKRGRATRSEFPSKKIDASTGLVSTVRDLASYDIALDKRELLQDDTLQMMWANTVSSAGVRPTGLGWFTQVYNGDRLVWHFGSAPDAFSSLILKVPARHLTLILLANSDGLSAPFELSQGDVTSSLFAVSFLRLFL